MAGRPWLLMLTAGAASLTVVTSAMSAATEPNAAASPTSRLGAGIARDIQDRDARAAQQARALRLREQMVKATENRLKADMDARARQDQAQAAQSAAATAQPPEPNQFDALARIYQAMKPAKAAPVFETLELDVQVAVAKRMKDKATAMILAAMSPTGAARLTMALAGRRPTAVPPARAAMRPTAASAAQAPATGVPAANKQR